MDEVDTLEAIERAHRAQREWGESTLKERSGLLRKLFGLVATNTDHLTQLVTLEGVMYDKKWYLGGGGGGGGGGGCW